MTRVTMGRERTHFPSPCVTACSSRSPEIGLSTVADKAPAQAGLPASAQQGCSEVHRRGGGADLQPPDHRTHRKWPIQAARDRSESLASLPSDSGVRQGNRWPTAVWLTITTIKLPRIAQAISSQVRPIATILYLLA